MESSIYSLTDITLLMISSFKHYTSKIHWATEILDIFDTLGTCYHTLNSVTDSPPQLHELGQKIAELENYLVVDLQRHICMQNLGSPCHINRLKTLINRAGNLLCADIHPDGESYEYSYSKAAAHLAAELQATFVEYGFCASIETLFDIDEAHRRMDALDLKIQSIEHNSSLDYVSSSINNNNNIQHNGLVLAELQDTVAQLHGIQQSITEENMERIEIRYNYLINRLMVVEQSLSNITIDISSSPIENYAQLQNLIKYRPAQLFKQNNIINILNEQMIHPGTRGWFFERLQQWLYMSEHRLFYVTGKTGYGKTALASTICKCYTSDVAASHFFQKSAGIKNEINSVSGMIQSIAAGLCQTFPMYLTYITDQYNNNPTIIDTVLRKKNWEDMYKVLLKDPLINLYSSEGACYTTPRRYLIVIDGLNECKPNDWTYIKRFIELFMSELPSHLKLFVTMHSQHYSHLVPNLLNGVDGILLDNRSWINRHIKDIEIYMASSLGAILSGEDDVDTPMHAKADEMTLQETIDLLLKMTTGRFDYAIELMQSFSIEMNKTGQFLGSVKKAQMPVRRIHGGRDFDEEMSNFASFFRAYRDKEGRSVCVRVMRQSTYPMDKSRVAMIRARHNIKSFCD